MYNETHPRKFASPQPREVEDKTYVSPLIRRDANKTPNQPLNIEVLCVNCQEKVSLQIIDEHSRMCYKATERSMQIDPSMNTEQPDFKLIRLKLALERQLETSEYSSNETRLRRQLVNSIDEILSFTGKLELKRIRELKGLICEIQDLSSSFRSSPQLLMYLERIQLLSEEKYKDIVTKNEQEQGKTNPSNYSSHPNQLNQSNVNYRKVNTTAIKLMETPRRQDSQRDRGSMRGSVTRMDAHSPVPRDSKALNQNTVIYQNQYSSVSSAMDPRNQSEILRNSFRKSIKNQDLTQNLLSMKLNREPSETRNSVSPFGQLMQSRSQTYLSELQSSGPSTNHPLGKEYQTFHPLLRQESTMFKGGVGADGPVRISHRLNNQGLSSNRGDGNLRGSVKRDDGVNSSMAMADTSPARVLAAKYATYNPQSPVLSKSEFKPRNLEQQRYNTPERSLVDKPDSMLSLASTYLANIIPQEFTTPNKRQRYGEQSPDRRSKSREAVRMELENTLESRKKELAKVTSLVNKYKYKTATIQISLNNNQSPIRGSSPSGMRFSPMISPSRTRIENRGNEQESNTSNTFFRPESLPKPQEIEPVRERVSVRSNQSNDGPSFDEFYQNLVFQGELSETMIEQRQFYSKCLEIKLKFKNNEIFQHIPIALIYKDAMKNNISQANWEKFIENAFSNPDKYIDASKLQKKKKKQGLKNNLIEIVQSKSNKNTSFTNFHVFSNLE